MGDKLTPSWDPGQARDRNPKQHDGGFQQNVPFVYMCYYKQSFERAVEPEDLAGLAV